MKRCLDVTILITKSLDYRFKWSFTVNIHFCHKLTQVWCKTETHLTFYVNNCFIWTLYVYFKTYNFMFIFSKQRHNARCVLDNMPHNWLFFTKRIAPKIEWCLKWLHVLYVTLTRHIISNNFRLFCLFDVDLRFAQSKSLSKKNEI